MLESQIAQLSVGPSQRNYGKLPSQPEANPREGVNAITLRSGRQLEAREPEKEGKADIYAETSTPKVSGGKTINEPESTGNV